MTLRKKRKKLTRAHAAKTLSRNRTPVQDPGAAVVALKANQIYLPRGASLVAEMGFGLNPG